MRLATRLATRLALLAATASAQDADPRPAWTYDPVAVGTVRSYAQNLTPESTTYWRTDSPTTVTRDGQRWVVRRTQRFFRLGDQDFHGWGRNETRTVVRFDTSSANVLVRSEDGTVQPLYPCRLDVPLAPSGGTCGDGQLYTKTSDGRLTFGDRGDGFSTVLQAGTGVIGGSTDRSPPYELVGAAIGGETLVEEPEAFPNSRIDPTPASRYAPRSVGDEWQYARSEGAAAPGIQYSRIEVTGTREIEGQTYLVSTASAYRPGDPGWTDFPEERYARFDTLSARVVQPGTPPGVQFDCPFDEPVTEYGDNSVYCDSNGDYPTLIANRREGALQIGDGIFYTAFRDYPYAGIADFDCYPTFTYAAGIGNTGYDCGSIVYGYSRLIYARVRQPDGSVLELGQRYAVASDTNPDALALALTVGPNPTPGPVTLRLAVPVGGSARWTVTDALGRTVWTRDDTYTPGDATVILDLSDASAGLYVVRAATASGAVTATVVRR